MSYNAEEKERIQELIDTINERKEERHPCGFSYHDAPMLRELVSLIEAHENDRDIDSLIDNERFFRYAAAAYADMGSRHALSAGYYTRMLTFSSALGKQHYADNEELRSQLKMDLSEAVFERNFYAPDKCKDIIDIGSELLSASEMQSIFNEAVSISHLTYDPVEATQAFLDLIDEADRYADEHIQYRGRGSCHSLWHLKQEYLEEHGVEWRTPTVMNRRKRID